MPNILFGPIAVTMIHDNSSSGGLVRTLGETGFVNFETVLPIPKYKYITSKKYQIKLDWIIGIEQSKFLLNIFRGIKVKGRCPVRFTVTLICQKPEMH
jgi:hypothetical protein